MEAKETKYWIEILKEYICNNNENIELYNIVNKEI